MNLFGDARVVNEDRGDLWLRGGRQELLYGAQRLISPLDWSNTRRTFDGAKLFWRGESWNADAFWTRPVPASQHVNNDSNFDHPDPHQEIFGLYTTRKDWKNQKLDLYYRRLAKYDGLIPFQNHLREQVGGSMKRGYGKSKALPVRRLRNSRPVGGFYIRRRAETGRPRLESVLWIYYDWASGNRDPADSVHGTFNLMFPLGHKYLGWMDLVGRQNIGTGTFN